MEAVGAYLGAYRVLAPNVKPGERVGIIGSTDVDMEFYQAFLAVAPIVGAEASLALMTPRQAPGHPAPDELTEFARTCDVAILAASHSIAHSHTSTAILSAGKKLVTFPVPSGNRAVGVLADLGPYSMDRLLEMKAVSERVAQVLDRGESVRITCKDGSSLTASIRARKPHIWYGICEPGPYTHNFSSEPPSEAHVTCIEDSAEGTLTVDGYISGVGMPSSPVKLKVVHGRVVEVSGGVEARKLERLLEAAGESAYVFSEFGVGTNPFQKIVDSNGDKKAVGSVHVAIGNNASSSFGGLQPDGLNPCPIHLDFVLLPPVTAEVDGRPLVEAGRLLA